MTHPSIDSFAQSLSVLYPGTRAWFWYTPQAPSEFPKILLSSFAEDSNMERLKSQAEKIPLPLGSLVYMGIAFIDEKGCVSMGASGFEEADLIGLSQWVQAHVAAYPGLARLKNLTLLNIDRRGSVRERIQNHHLWNNVPTLPFKDILQKRAKDLSKLPPNYLLWFWMTDKWMDGKPHVILGRIAKDPEGTTFLSDIQQARRQCAAGAQVIQGTICRQEDGRYVFSVPDLYGAKPVMNTLIEAHPNLFSFLHGARIVQMSEQGFGDFLEISTEESSLGIWEETNQRLQVLKEGDILYFWFTNGSPEAAILLVHPDMEQLKTLAKAHSGAKQSVRGTLSREAKGWLHFKSKKDAPTFFTDVSNAIQNKGVGLQELKSARMTCKDKSGTLLGRYRAKDFWSTET